VSGARDRRLWIDAGRGTAGLYLLTRDEERRAASAAPDATGSTRHALLLFRKHLSGVRVTGLRRVAGARALVLEAGAVTVGLRLGGSAPAATLVVGDAPSATLGAGPAAWPLPAAEPAREWDRITPETLEDAARDAGAAGRPVHRAIAAACPSLGPLLARELDGTPAALRALRSRLGSPRPTLHAPRPLEECDDADLAPDDALALAPIVLSGRFADPVPTAAWLEVAAAYLLARRRGDAFAARRRAALAAARHDVVRLAQLETNLSRDLSGLADPEILRRRAEALLATPDALPAGAAEAEVPDPREPRSRLRFAVDPRLGGPANADRLFEKARRIERARLQVGERVLATAAGLAAARAREAAVSAARNLADLGPPPASRDEGSAKEPGAGPLRFLTGRGLTILVGRGARENHRLTFSTARPEDLWLHARDVPGAHVILRDDEGRANPEDIREAAEVAAFFSGAREQPRADVHVARRKHVRSAEGGPGRVRLAHSENVLVSPRDPVGRLRRR